MADHSLVQYIKDARKQQLSSEAIIKSLTDAGWHVHDIVDILLDHDQHSVADDASDENIIAIRNITKTYGTFKALDNISFNVKKGSVTALLGPNGAGKTTLVRILTTLLAPNAGTATVDGLDAVKDAQKLRSIIGLAGQYAAVDETLTGRENLVMVGQLYHLSAKDAKARAQDLLERFDLEEAADRTTKTYSGGMRRRLDLAASLIIKPKILFLDEPTTGLDPRSRFGLWDVIRDLVQDGTTVLLTTQYLEEADQLAHAIFVIDHGHIIAQGTADELKRQVGGDVLELHLANHDDVVRAAELVKQFGNQEPYHNAGTGVVTLPIDGGASVLVEVVRQLDSAHLKLSDILLRRPSLDDVFMKLTGHITQ